MVAGFWQVGPNFLAGEGKDRGEHQRHIAQDAVDGGLRRASGNRIRLFNIKSVLDDVQIEVGQVDGAEVVDGVVDLMEIKLLIALVALLGNLVHAGQRPAVQLMQLIVCNRIGVRVKVVEVSEDVARGVSNLAVNLRKLF